MAKTHSFPITSLSAGNPFTNEVDGTSYELEAGSGARLVRIYWKATKAQPNPRPAVWVALKKIRLSDVQAETVGLQWATVLHDRIDSIQDTLARDWLNSHSADVSGVIPDSEVNESAVIGWARRDAVGSRLSSDTIGAWFDASLCDPIMTALAGKGMDADKIASSTKAYRDNITKLSAPVPSLDETALKALQRAIALASESPMRDALSERINSCLDRFNKASALEDVL